MMWAPSVDGDGECAEGQRMSLVTLMNEPEVRDRLSWCIPDIADRKVVAATRVPRAKWSSPQRESTIGTAVDYALRFEIERHNRHAVKRAHWVADHAARLGPRYAELLSESKTHVEAHVHSRAPWRGLTVARRAVLLAQLDVFHRSGGAYVPPLPTADRRDVVEVFRLVQIAPSSDLSHPGCVHLNPAFGRFSSLVGGADADLIVGTQLIDVKLSLPPTGLLEPDWIRQLVGYAMLAAWARVEAPGAPQIRTLGIYFARQGVLWPLNPGLLRHSGFSATARWLRERVEGRLTASTSSLGVQGR